MFDIYKEYKYSSHPFLFLYSVTDALQSAVHHPTVKTEEVHIFLYLLLRHAFLHYPPQLVQKTCYVHAPARGMRTDLLFGTGGFGSENVVFFVSPHLKVCLALFKHHKLVPLLIPVKRLFLELLLQRTLQFLVLKRFSPEGCAFSSLQHL